MGRIIEGVTTVFCPPFRDSERWKRAGVSDMFIHNYDFENIIQRINTRQTIMMEKKRDFDATANIILDYVQDDRIDPTPNEFWNKEFGLESKMQKCKELGIIFHMDCDNIEKVIEPNFLLMYAKRMQQSNE